MKLTVFRADKGDCLLLTSSNGTNILADGGMRDSYRQHVAPALGKLHQDGQVLDLVYLSHIDQDHIAGILQLVNDLVDWRVFRYQTTNGNPTFPTPGSPEPPAIRQIWHNAFHEQVGKNAGPIEEMLAANASILSADANFLDIAERSSDLATSMAEAVKLSRHIGARQLGIPLNPEYDRGLMYVADPADAIDIGDLSIWVIGPFAEDLAVLRRDWNTWLRSQRGKTALRRIRDQARRDEELLGSNEFERFMRPLLLEAAELGDRDKVTPPNLASLMLLVEEDRKKVLLTGDGHWQDILEGLDACGKLDASGSIHVDVLKVQHHGSEHNTHLDFAKRVTADHYVFCGDGAHDNPDPRVIQAYIDSRLGPPSKRSRNAEVGNRFTLWFNASPTMAGAKHPAHMRKVRQKVERAVQHSHGQMRSRFLQGSKFELRLS